MSTIDLSQYGISGAKVVHNPSWNELFIDETKPGLEGYEKGQLTELGAVNVMTGIYTGRSPKDKFFVKDDTSANTIWWTTEGYKNDNKPITPATWDALKAIADKELSDKTLYVVDAFCGTNVDTRLAVRFVMEVAWQAHFVTNMFIRPTKEELDNFKPDFVVLNASKAKVENWKELGINSETCVAFNLTERMQLIINTWYGGEMKKGMFSIMNYYNPLRGIASMHCSAETIDTSCSQLREPKNTAIFILLILYTLLTRCNYPADRFQTAPHSPAPCKRGAFLSPLRGKLPAQDMLPGTRPAGALRRSDPHVPCRSQLQCQHTSPCGGRMRG